MGMEIFVAWKCFQVGAVVSRMKGGGCKVSRGGIVKSSVR